MERAPPAAATGVAAMLQPERHIVKLSRKKRGGTRVTLNKSKLRALPVEEIHNKVALESMTYIMHAMEDGSLSDPTNPTKESLQELLDEGAITTTMLTTTTTTTIAALLNSGNYRKISTGSQQRVLYALNNPYPCDWCGTRETPERRRGPKGRATLCNACGLRYRKQLKEPSRIRKDMSIARLINNNNSSSHYPYIK